MDEESKKKMPLIVTQNTQKKTANKPLPYQVPQETYEVYQNTNNPFEERDLLGNPKSNQKSSQQVQELFQYFAQQKSYHIAYPEESSPYSKRKISQPIQRIVTKSNFPTAKKQENVQKLPKLIQLFFKHVLQKLKEEPQHFAYIVNELVFLLQEYEIKIKIYDAYRTFSHWDQFIDTLEKISNDNEIENFELFCSAIFGFYSQLE